MTQQHQEAGDAGARPRGWAGGVAMMVAALLLAGTSRAQAGELGSSSEALEASGVADVVDAYTRHAVDETALVGGPGSAGYDRGFYLRSGDTSLRIGATFQARFEAWSWDDAADAARLFQGPGTFAGDTSGFSLPRATLKFSGTAPCCVAWYAELEFGHFGRDVLPPSTANDPLAAAGVRGLGASQFTQSWHFDVLREAWIEWRPHAAFAVRFGQIRTPTTRQMMVRPEQQQFVDTSIASSFTGITMPGFTDRNRDHGVCVHGTCLPDDRLAWMVSVTNGDGGDSIRNVLDHRSSDNLAFGARLNYAFLRPIGYTEGALGQDTCAWYGEVGAWAHYYADRSDRPHVAFGDSLNWGVDVALGYGGWSLTAAFHSQTVTDSDLFTPDDPDAISWLVQLGHHFVGTPFEVAARVSAFETDSGAQEHDRFEIAAALNYYLNGHANKLQLDVGFFSADGDDEIGMLFPYPGQPRGFGGDNEAIQLRFQWQLVL